MLQLHNTYIFKKQNFPKCIFYQNNSLLRNTLYSIRVSMGDYTYNQSKVNNAFQYQFDL